MILTSKVISFRIPCATKKDHGSCSAHLVQQEADPGRDVFFYTVGFMVNAATAVSANDARQPRRGAVHLAYTSYRCGLHLCRNIPSSDTVSSPNAEETISLRADIKVKHEGSSP